MHTQHLLTACRLIPLLLAAQACSNATDNAAVGPTPAETQGLSTTLESPSAAAPTAAQATGSGLTSAAASASESNPNPSTAISTSVKPDSVSAPGAASASGSAASSASPTIETEATTTLAESGSTFESSGAGSTTAPGQAGSETSSSASATVSSTSDSQTVTTQPDVTEPDITEPDVTEPVTLATDGTAPAQPQVLTPTTVYLAGDSTVSQYTDTPSLTDQAGWGQMLQPLLDPLARVDNRAVGGRTARRFIDDGFLAEIAATLTTGDTLMVQFGTNDGNKTATYELNGEQIPYYLDPATDFKMYLRQYIDLAESRGANTVLVTPPPRNSAYCTGGNGTGAHAAAMRELGVERGVPVADLNAQSVAYLTAICPAPTPEDFFLLRADGTVDGTHFQENGARKLAGFVVDELITTRAALSVYVLR